MSSNYGRRLSAFKTLMLPLPELLAGFVFTHIPIQESACI
jgi:hypothetical protein